MVLRKYIESIVLTKVFAVYCSILLNVLHNGTTYLYWWTSCIQEPINIIIFLTTVHFNISIYNNQSHLKAYHAYFYKKKYVMDENDPLSEWNKIPLGHNCTNGAVYSKISFKVKICSAP